MNHTELPSLRPLFIILVAVGVGYAMVGVC